MIIDVRDKSEIENEGQVTGALNIPLCELSSNTEAIIKISSFEKIQFLCRSGNRAQIAKEQIEKQMSSSDSLEVIEGGLKSIEQKKIIRKQNKSKFSIMRQVMMIAGLMIACFGLIGIFINPLIHWLPVFIGIALFLAGLSGICPMAIILGKMPWNR